MNQKTVRRIGLILCELFSLITLVYIIASAQYDRLLLACATPLIILVPWAAERLFRFTISLPVYLVCLFYAIGPMLGHCYNFYYTIPWWDKMLHILGGVMFTFFGLILFEKYVGKNRKTYIIAAVFALCLSVSVSVLWEFCEFSADNFLGMDMQDDVVVDHINSYLLDERIGVAASIDKIEEVVVNGERLPVDGYIDIGLTDTMLDMLLESFGALIVSVVYIARKGRLTVFEISGGK